MEVVNQIFGILIVMDNRRVSANGRRLITQPCKAFTNIFNVFACNCHDNIIGLCHLLLFCTFFTYKGKCLIREQAIFCINLAVMDARYALCKKIFLLKVSSTRNRCDFTQLLIFHTIRAKLPEQFIQLTHSHPLLSLQCRYCTTPSPHNSTYLPVFRSNLHRKQNLLLIQQIPGNSQ